MKAASLSFFFLLITTLVFSQVEMNVNVSGASGSGKVFVTAFSAKDKKTVSLNGKKGKLDLIRFSQYVVVAYQKGSKPFVISVDTEECPNVLQFNPNLGKGAPNQEDYRPQLHYSRQGGKYTMLPFDLDKVKDKAGFASQMADANKDVVNFYKTGAMPKARSNQRKFENEEAMRKSEHVLGQEIYKLLGKKRALEMDLERLEKAGYASSIKGENLSAQWEACRANGRMLTREMQYRQIAWDLAKKEVEKEQLVFNRKLKRGENPSGNALSKARTKLANAKEQYEISEINMENKQADCWEIKLRSEMEKLSDSPLKRVKEIEISDVRLRQRKGNTRRLYQKHNALATRLTGRERVVELANAQKFIADNAKANLALAQNKLQILTYRNQSKGGMDNQIAAAKKDIKKKEEIAYQAEMGYLEHMWHLRQQKDYDKDFANNLYARQSQLLEFTPFPEKKIPLTPEEELAKFEEDAEALFNELIVLEGLDDDRGIGKKLDFKDDFYEIVVNDEGKKNHYKNGRPITALTYRFETVEKYGEFLDNKRFEPEKKKRFLDWFKKKTEF